jgi:hypothetical protein
MYMVLFLGLGEWYPSNLWNLSQIPPSSRSCACRLKSYARFNPLVRSHGPSMSARIELGQWISR